ncbi:MAG: NADH-quinone oxidoreductase subunit C [Candidatus Bathyarchaeia archaeon]
MSEAELIEAITASHAEWIVSAEVLRSLRVSVVVKREAFLAMAESLRDEFGFKTPSAAGGMDYPKEDRMQMIYYLFNPDSKITIMLRVDLPRDDLTLPTLTGLWEAISFHEREAHEMFGIEFEGHPNMIPLLLPPDWRGGYPLRKDFKGEAAEE